MPCVIIWEYLSKLTEENIAHRYHTVIMSDYISLLVPMMLPSYEPED